MAIGDNLKKLLNKEHSIPPHKRLDYVVRVIWNPQTNTAINTHIVKELLPELKETIWDNVNGITVQILEHDAPHRDIDIEYLEDKIVITSKFHDYFYIIRGKKFPGDASNLVIMLGYTE